MTYYGPYDRRKTLNPGEVARQTLHLVPTGGQGNNLTLHWSFRPRNAAEFWP